ncbi:MAG: energy transducer TonB [Pseudomonadota bacterium]
MRYLVSGVMIWLLSAATVSAFAQDYDITDVALAQDVYIDAPTDDTRASLLQALADYAGDPTVETVRAHHTIMSRDIQAGDYNAMYESAAAARAHYEPVADVIPEQFAEASYFAAIARFNSELEADAMIAMTHVQGFATAQQDDNGERADWAQGLMYKSDAWVLTMDAFFDSIRERHPSDDEIEEILKSYGADDETINARSADDTDDSGLPFCAGVMLQKPKMRYPRRKFRKGMFGAVILGLEFDEEGQVINPTVLASVPLDEFDERSLQTVGKWRFKPDDPDQVGVTCRLNRTDVVQPVVFQFR